MKILNKEKLSELLIAKWTQFIDVSKLMSFIIENTKKHENQMLIIDNTTIKHTGNQISLSRFDLNNYGFIIWVEFKIPLNDKIASGTTELLINSEGNITHIQTIGNIYFIK